MLVFESPQCPVSSAEVAAFARFQTMQYRSFGVQAFDITRKKIFEIKCGQTVYHLLYPTIGTFTFRKWGRGEFTVEGFDWLTGKGDSPNNANQDWLDQFHATFQHLYVIRPFEMTTKEAEVWNNIQNRIDLARYRFSQDIVVRQEGRVIRARPLPDTVEWEDGTRERIKIARMPAEFAGYKPGQRFEAMVCRNPITFKIRKVDYVKRLRELTGETDAEVTEFWNSVPTSNDLPDSDWL